MCNLFLYETLINYVHFTSFGRSKANYFVPYRYTQNMFTNKL